MIASPRWRHPQFQVRIRKEVITIDFMSSEECNGGKFGWSQRQALYVADFYWHADSVTSFHRLDDKGVKKKARSQTRPRVNKGISDRGKPQTFPGPLRGDCSYICDPLWHIQLCYQVLNFSFIQFHLYCNACDYYVLCFGTCIDTITPTRISQLVHVCETYWIYMTIYFMELESPCITAWFLLY